MRLYPLRRSFSLDFTNDDDNATVFLHAEDNIQHSINLKSVGN